MASRWVPLSQCESSVHSPDSGLALTQWLPFFLLYVSRSTLVEAMCRYGTAWWVGCTLFLMILHSFPIYLHVTWRSQEDQGPVIHCSSTFHCFCWGMLQHGYGTTLWVLLRFSWSSPDFWSIYLSFEGSDETRGLRFTVPPHFTFFPMGCYSMARHNSASFPSFFMILCLFLIYVSVVWRAQ
jgi:hypothetical protein